MVRLKNRSGSRRLWIVICRKLNGFIDRRVVSWQNFELVADLEVQYPIIREIWDKSMLRLDLVNIVQSLSKSLQTIFEFWVLTSNQTILVCTQGFFRWNTSLSMTSSFAGFILSTVAGARRSNVITPGTDLILLHFELFVLFLLSFLLVSLSCL